MTFRAVRFVSWMALPVTAVLIMGRIYLAILNGNVTGAGVVVNVVLDLVLLGFVALGLLVVHRRPGNPVGWIIAGVGVTAVASEFLQSYGVYALFTEPGRFPWGETTAWLSTLIFIPVLFAAPAMLFLLFPNGNLLGRRWRLVFWLVILSKTLREETGLEVLNAELLTLIRETMQPEHVSLWLRQRERKA